MKVYIYSLGDSSVGINPSESILDTNIIKINSVKERNEIRQELYKMFDKFHDNGETEVYFEDECRNCCNLKIKCICQKEEIE